MVSWIYLIFASCAEVCFSISLKLSEQFTKIIPTISFIMFSIISFYLMTRSLRELPLWLVYAVWSGLGSAGTALVEVLFFKQPMSLTQGALLVILIGCVIGLKLAP